MYMIYICIVRVIYSQHSLLHLINNNAIRGFIKLHWLSSFDTWCFAYRIILAHVFVTRRTKVLFKICRWCWPAGDMDRLWLTQSAVTPILLRSWLVQVDDTFLLTMISLLRSSYTFGHPYICFTRSLSATENYLFVYVIKTQTQSPFPLAHHSIS